jgi:exosortase family protein XrtF
VVGNFLYGLYVTVYTPAPDPATHWVTYQTATVLTSVGWPTQTEDRADKPTTHLKHNGKNVLAVYEGCNGINTMIIFAAFLVAFGPASKMLLWFLPLGLLVIHVANLARITFLFWVSIYTPAYMYFTHKYFFTAILYVVIFALWVLWVRYSSRKTVIA